MVLTSEGEELLVGAALDDHTAVDDADHVGILDGRETMGNDNGGTSPAGLVERLLDNLLRLRVEGRRGLVEQEDLGVADECTGNLCEIKKTLSTIS